MDGFTNDLVGTASANVAAHGLIDLRVTGVRCPRQQRRSGHDLPGLAVPALWYVDFDPGSLHGIIGIRRNTLDGGDLLPGNTRNGRAAGTRRLAVHMNRT